MSQDTTKVIEQQETPNREYVVRLESTDFRELPEDAKFDDLAADNLRTNGMREGWIHTGTITQLDLQDEMEPVRGTPTLFFKAETLEGDSHILRPFFEDGDYINKHGVWSRNVIPSLHLLALYDFRLREIQQNKERERAKDENSKADEKPSERILFSLGDLITKVVLKTASLPPKESVNIISDFESQIQFVKSVRKANDRFQLMYDYRNKQKIALEEVFDQDTDSVMVLGEILSNIQIILSKVLIKDDVSIYSFVGKSQGIPQYDLRFKTDLYEFKLDIFHRVTGGGWMENFVMNLLDEENIKILDTFSKGMVMGGRGRVNHAASIINQKRQKGKQSLLDRFESITLNVLTGELVFQEKPRLKA